ncbi:MAG: ATP-binding protein [Bacteroidetes bacterium]|nr:MAG: ATP-binding protein [Bacteroidota bacterium]RLD82718.1 MAG: ATP-binding protein [Bacteroidota bacterium]
MGRKEKLTLDSRPENISSVERFVEEICDYYNINDTYFGNILIALTEAFNNALIHGNNSDASRKIQIIFESKPKGLSFTVSDEGTGYNPDEVPDPLDLDIDFNSQTSRGLFLIRSLSDKVEFNKEGSSVEMFFRISGIGHEAMKKRIGHFNEYFQTKKQKV